MTRMTALKDVSLRNTLVIALVVCACITGIVALFITAPVLPVHAQYSQTITTTLLPATAPGSFTAFPVIPNIGQVTHFITVTSNDATSSICHGFFSAQIVGSYNSPGTNYQQLPLTESLIAAIPTTIHGNVSRTWQLSGAYPALNLAILNEGELTPSNCTFSAYYSGIISSGLGPAVTAQAAGTAQESALAVYEGNIATSGDTMIVASPAGGSAVNAGLFLAAYGLELCNTTAAQTVKFNSTTSGASPITYMTYPNLIAGQCVTIPTQQLPLFNALQSGTASVGGNPSQLYVNLANSTNVTIKLWYRFE